MEIQVKLFRLNSGEDLLAKYTDNGHEYFLEKPMIIIPQDGGRVGYSYYMPYTVIPEQGVTIPKSYIAFETRAEENMEQAYIAMWEEEDKPKIFMPDQGIITG